MIDFEDNVVWCVDFNLTGFTPIGFDGNHEAVGLIG